MANFYANYQARRRLKKFRHLVLSLRHNDDDILPEQTKTALDALAEDSRQSLASGEQAAAFLKEAPARLGRIVPSPKHRILREWVDILAVVLAAGFGIRGLFLEPYKIPTSSMQPTLYGIHYMEREGSSNPLLGRVPEPVGTMLFSTRRAELTVQSPGGEVDPESFQYRGGLLFGDTAFVIGGVRYTLPGAPNKVIEYTGLEPYKQYAVGEKLADGFLSMGDHLFVDRVSHHLTGLKRGDVVVFTTENIVSLTGKKLVDESGYFYIKRLVGLPGDTLKLLDGNLFLKPAGETEFQHIREFGECFETIYSGKGGYQGYTVPPDGFYLSRADEEYVVAENSYFMLGDNSRFSSDSRYWGVVPRRNIVGRAVWVFWPFSRRWGAIGPVKALEVPTGAPERGTFPSMYLQ